MRCRLALIAALAASAASAEQRMIADGEAAAYHAVGRLNVAGNRHCTAVLVTDRLALTAAHCLYNELTGRRAMPADLKFVAGQRRDAYAALRDVTAAAVPPDYVFTTEPALDGVGRDVALLALAEPIGAGAAAPFPAVGWAGEGPVSIVAYGRDRAYAASVRDGCGVVADDGRVVALDCAVTFGVSGAPVLAAGADGPEVVAIVSAMGEGPSGEIAYAVRVGDWMATLLNGLAAR